MGYNRGGIESGLENGLKRVLLFGVTKAMNSGAVEKVAEIASFAGINIDPEKSSRTAAVALSIVEAVGHESPITSSIAGAFADYFTVKAGDAVATQAKQLAAKEEKAALENKVLMLEQQIQSVKIQEPSKA